MRCLDRFNNKMMLSGGSLRNENIINSRELLKEVFEDDASFSLGIYMWEHGKEDYTEDTPIKIRLFNRKFSPVNGLTEKFQTYIDTEFLVGDIIYDSIKNRHLMCTEVFNVDDIHYEGKFTLCNWVLKWQDKETGKILKYPCIDINSTQYNSGENNGKVISYGNSQHQLTLPYNEHTVELSTPQRFYLDSAKKNKTTFIVTQNDTTSWRFGEKGVIKLTVLECASDSDTDRPDLEICDYIDFDKINEDLNDIAIERSVIKYSSNVIKSGGNIQWFSSAFFNKDGEEIFNVEPQWNIICDFKNNLEVFQSDNKLYISIDDDRFVDEEFKIELSDSYGSYKSSIIVKIESLL